MPSLLPHTSKARCGAVRPWRSAAGFADRPSSSCAVHCPRRLVEAGAPGAAARKRSSASRGLCGRVAQAEAASETSSTAAPSSGRRRRRDMERMSEAAAAVVVVVVVGPPPPPPAVPAAAAAPAAAWMRRRAASPGPPPPATSSRAGERSAARSHCADVAPRPPPGTPPPPPPGWAVSPADEPLGGEAMQSGARGRSGRRAATCVVT